MRSMVTILLLAGLAAGIPGAARAQPAPVPTAQDQAVNRVHGLSLMGKPALPPGFTHFPYVNPDAPKGGEVALSAVGTFDSFNPFIVRGTAAADVSRVWDTLLRPNADEAEGAYGHLAETIEIPADHLGVTFELRPQARFHDGTPVTAEDVVWTFNMLLEKGRPFYRQYYADVASVTAEGPRRVVFRFKSAHNRELPLILGQMAVLPKHWWAGRDFDRPLTEPPLGSGPYRIGRFEFGRTLVMERVKDYWARDLPTARGLANFDQRRTEYFRDATVAMEAFKAGQTDFREENIAKDWATGYDFPAVQKGLVKKELLRHHMPTGMQGYGMNTRRPLFRDVRVRQALALVFDFEWANANLFYGSYTRTDSYFSNSDLASSGLPEGAELALLDKYRDKLPPQLFTEPYKLPVTDGSGNNRAELRRALALLKEAGWEVRDRKLVNAQGQPFSFEILLDQPAFERVSLPYVQWLARLGVDARVRTVDPAQYQRLMDSYDYDMSVVAIGESESPGNEQSGYWTCASARPEGGDNLMGICDPVVDALVDQVVNASDRERLVTATRALDRVLLWGWYVVPQWHLQSVRVAYWDRFGKPDKPVRTGLAFDSWWIDPARAAATDEARRSGNLAR
ncbi:extracellular solute-binding protein [Limobrevibacterium gyesilva]|uniref:ABC transporter substrate-binding protein n=1 Tax=Limobrevibacterium gyesilva TaxID=2991712 RepID=A0AA42CGA8_9PROT|nr:extracellular solute-binding protein [Limobrevibacterium gyesilva]MCW3477499.1 ABC transporter substrate-binding protein [Limobrevibacterium gyesilva]